MFFTPAYFILCLIICSSSVIGCDIAKAFTDNGVVSDVIDVAPKELLKADYPSGVSIHLGNEVTPTQVKDTPKLTWTADSDSYYTLIFTDPDAPTRQDPKIGEFRHWFVVNIPGDNVESGDSIIDFIGSGPPEGTGIHRYVFLVFKQNGKITVDEPHTSNRSIKGRPMTKVRETISKYNLGNPVAGNFYTTQYDDYVPILMAQISDAKK